MYLEEQHRMYELAYYLITADNYEVLHINNKDEELWLEKYENKKSTVIRLIHKGYDWKNHLKTDIARVFQKTKAMKRFLLGKTIEIHNVYISSYVPIDDWEILKKPMQLKERNPLKMNVYYLADNNFNEEINRLQKEIGATIKKVSTVSSNEESKKRVNYYKVNIANALNEKRNKEKAILTFGTPILTYLLLIMNVVMFLIVEKSGGSNVGNLIDFGAKYNPAIINGEWWRIVSSMFLHIGLLHLAMNMLALYYLGTAVERIYGSWRFFFIYIFAGVGGGLASFAFTVNVAAGASGAIFGLFGALLFFGLIHRNIFLQTIGKNLLVIVGINLVFGFIVPQIDNGAHVGGLIAGFLVSAILHLPRNRKVSMQFISLLLYIIISVGLVTIGVTSNINHSSYDLFETEELIKENKYEAAVIRATDGLNKSSDVESELLFQRSYANIQLNNTELAIEDLEQSIMINRAFAAAHYNLAILYFENNEQEKALESIENAYELNPDDDEYIKLYEEITGESIQ